MPAPCPPPPRVWSVRYNHSHDQLVLTGSSDSRVILSNMASISSEPFGHLADDDDLSDQEERHLEEKYVLAPGALACGSVSGSLRLVSDASTRGRARSWAMESGGSATPSGLASETPVCPRSY